LLNKFLINKSKLKRYILSALSAFVGIQSNKNRKIDFASNNPLGFIIAGIVLTIIFIFIIKITISFILRH
tara:strand:+ start:370 stop:579 length:210 start_codon:yes stop_codon:yes gene_type:complete